MPGILKIGHTTRSPQLRCKEISNATGVPVDFELAYVAEVAGSKAAEKWVHQQLGPLRYNNRREFFKLGLKEAKKVVAAAADKFADKGLGNSRANPLKKRAKRCGAFLFKVCLFLLWEVCAVGVSAYLSTHAPLVDSEQRMSLLFLLCVAFFTFLPLLVKPKFSNAKG